MITKAGGLTWGCAPRQDVKKCETGKAPIKTRCALTRDNQGSPTCARGGREGMQDAREARVIRDGAPTGGAESSVAVGDRHS